MEAKYQDLISRDMATIKFPRRELLASSTATEDNQGNIFKLYL